MAPDPSLKKQLRQENLRFVSDNSPGFFREKFGKEFKYYDLDGKTIKDKKDLQRIKSLAIPPAWKDVWICPTGNGHIQATGIDDKGRKQYIYHSGWIALSQENKFNQMVDFGLSLPKIRQRVSYYLQSKKLDKNKILATVVWLLEHTFIRIGNEEYSKENQHFGLTTLRNKHVKIRGSQILFEFIGKSGVDHKIAVINKKIAKTIKKCTELPGFELFQFIDDKNERHVVDSSDVNLFLKDTAKDDFSAKDFRTWGASNISATNFFKLGSPDNEKSLNLNIKETVKKVANHLNNTLSVCRNYYIHPKVIESYQKNILIPHFTKFSKAKSAIRGLDWDEFALIRLLQLKMV